MRPGDLVLGHLVFWDATLRGTAGKLPPDIVGVTSSAPCPVETALGLRAAGLARLLQVYGSAETAGIGWCDDPAHPYTLFPGWRRDRDGLCRDEQQVPVPDRLAWEGERFRVLGRHDGAVQVGGVNVSPEQVGAVLAGQPAVAAIAVRAMRPNEGTCLKAFVVPAGAISDPGDLQAELHRFAAVSLCAAERSRRLQLRRRPAPQRDEQARGLDQLRTRNVGCDLNGGVLRRAKLTGSPWHWCMDPVIGRVPEVGR